MTKSHLLLSLSLVITISIVYWLLRNTVFGFNSQEFNSWIDALNWRGPIAMVILMMIEIIIPILPGGWLGLANGYLFGPWLGFVYSYIASVGGSMILFLLVRKFGQPFIALITSPERSKQLTHKIHQARSAFGLLYAIPLFPVEIVTLLLGLTTMHTRKFIILMMLGYIPNMVALNFLGTIISGPDNHYTTIFLILISITVFYLLTTWLRQRIFAKNT